MAIPPVFATTSDAAEYLAQHGKIGHYLTVAQYSRLVAFAFLWADGGTSLSALMLEFYRGEIQRLDEIIGDNS
jgi:hypothetical protein